MTDGQTCAVKIKSDHSWYNSCF